MPKTKIKICGIKEAEHAHAAIDAGVDYIGVNFVPGSPRQLEIPEARNLVAEICLASTDVEPVALFADQPVEFIREVLDNADFKIVQLHGEEDRTFVGSLAEIKVFKAVPFNLERIDVWRDPPGNVTALLIDAPTQPGELTGGTGRAFDWDALANLDTTGLPPIVVAGGLTPDNVAEAITTAHPYAVDTSSGVESSRGVKDAGLIRRFILAAQSADISLDG